MTLIFLLVFSLPVQQVQGCVRAAAAACKQILYYIPVFLLNTAEFIVIKPFEMKMKP